MVGDALGDWEAAVPPARSSTRSIPAIEDESWQRFFEEALPRFFAGNYAGEYMDAQLERFVKLLPEQPPWKRD